MDTLKTVDGLNRAGTYKAELEKAEAVDDVTLKVTLKQTDWRFFFKSLTFRFDLGDDVVVQPDHFWSTIAEDKIISTNVFDAAKGYPISTGPYGVGTSTDQVTNYDLRPTWWAVETVTIPTARRRASAATPWPRWRPPPSSWSTTSR